MVARCYLHHSCQTASSRLRSCEKQLTRGPRCVCSPSLSVVTGCAWVSETQQRARASRSCKSQRVTCSEMPGQHKPASMTCRAQPQRVAGPGMHAAAALRARARATRVFQQDALLQKLSLRRAYVADDTQHRHGHRELRATEGARVLYIG